MGVKFTVDMASYLPIIIVASAVWLRPVEGYIKGSIEPGG